MFEELRGLPPKPPKPVSKKKRGCLNVGYGFLVVLLAFAIGLIGFLVDFDTSGLKEYQDLANELKNPVDENVVAPNAVKTEDFVQFEALIETSLTNTKGLQFFDENHIMQLESFKAEDLVFNQNITLTGKDIACLATNLLQADWTSSVDENYTKDTISVIEIDIQSQNEITTVKTILKVNANNLFENFKSFKEQYNVTDTFYFANTFTFNNLTFEVLTASLQINQLSKASNQLLLEILAGSGTNAVDNLCKKTPTIFVNALSDFKKTYNAILLFNPNTITVIKV